MTRSLSNRLSVILALMLTASGVASLLILKFTIAPAFNTLESGAAEVNLGRSELAIDTQLQQLKAIAGDWAPWDAPNAFVSGENPDFVWLNVDLNTLRNIEIELLQFFDSSGKLLWTGYKDHGQFADIESLGRLGHDDELYSMLTGHASPDSAISGLLMTARGPMLLVSVPLVEEADVGPINGTMIMGQILTTARLQNLQNHIKVPFDIIPIQKATATLPSVTRQLGSAANNAALHLIDEATIRSYRMLTDISGKPLGLLVSRTAREVTALGQEAANLALQLFVAMALVLLGLAWLIIRRDIVGRLQRLAEHITRIRRSGDLSARIAPDRDDEIGRLGQSFNALTDELQQARRELVEQSFQAGRADTAADVLHNVRNAMTPVINVSENLTGTLQEVTRLRLARAAEELADPDCPDDRRNDLLQYVIAAAERISSAGSDATHDVNLIYRQARLVAEILSSQEKIARFQPLQERINLAELVSESAAVLPANKELDVDLQVAPELTGVCIMANSVHLLQIISNVMLNAYESAERAGRQIARIEVRITGTFAGNPDLVQLSISDNGDGFDQQLSAQLFQRGFTSKTAGGHGLGLHWCANAVGAIGGSMAIESAGPGKGATVHIRLPVDRGDAVDNANRLAG